MNIYELGEMISSLKNEDLAINVPIIEFYEAKRTELIEMITVKINIGLNAL